MSRISFENYGRRAELLADPTRAAARYVVQKAAEKRVLGDILAKLALRPEDRLLDIGCNIGNLLIPLSFFVAHAVGVDHPSCLDRLRRRLPQDSPELIPGNFLEIEVAGPFDKILCYSVLHYLAPGDLLPFCDKAVSLLAPGGRVLFGDIPNQSRKRRFLASPEGQRFACQWEELRAAHPEVEPDLPQDPDLVQFNDELVAEITSRYRRQGLEVEVVEQGPDLPFGHTREDILISRPR